MTKSLGRELYELLNPYDPTAGANPATWDQTDEDYQAHYERCAVEFHNRIVSKCTFVTNVYLNDGDWDSDTAEAIMHDLIDLKAANSQREDEEPQRSEGDTALQQAQQKSDTNNTVEDPESDSVEFRGLMT